jgi:DNA-binding protein Fis
MLKWHTDLRFSQGRPIRITAGFRVEYQTSAYLVSIGINMQEPFSENGLLIDGAAIGEFLEVLEGKRRLSEVQQWIQLEIAVDALNDGVPLTEILQQAISQLEKHLITRVLEITSGNKAEAVRLLKIDYKTLYRKMHKYVIKAIGQ